MAQKLINIRVEIATATDLDLDKWAKDEGRSKRRHVAIIVRKLTDLRHTHHEQLAELGLVDKYLSAAN